MEARKITLLQLTIRISEGDDSDLRELQDIGKFGSISDVSREALRRGVRDMKKEYGLTGKKGAKKRKEEE